MWVIVGRCTQSIILLKDTGNYGKVLSFTINKLPRTNNIRVL